MKNKIIYISGNDFFNASDVKNAFETVREKLNLDKDTLLFGVPLDCDDVSNGNFDDIKPVDEQNNIFVETKNDVQLQGAVIDEIPVKKAKRTKKTPEKIVIEEPDNKDQTEEKIIPITSILTGQRADIKNNDDNTCKNIPETENIPEPDDDLINLYDDVLDSKSATTDDVQFNQEVDAVPEYVDSVETTVVISETTDDTDNENEQIENIDDNDLTDLSDTPIVMQPETTLEQLLESVKSLNEDTVPDEDVPVAQDINNVDNDFENTDATLEQLANDYINNKDKIINTTKNKNTTRGKIGSLKHILSFKSHKPEDPGLMGDLFRWAGVAANDDEFSIPEFFPTTASKK